MNFATLKGLTIPEGVVKQIADASGRVLWSAVKPVTITVTGEGLLYYVEISHNGTVYTAPATFTANAGDTIGCRLEECWDYSYLTINGSYIWSEGENEEDLFYEYTVVSDATIDLYVNEADEKRDRIGIIAITEVPEGHALVQIRRRNQWTS